MDSTLFISLGSRGNPKIEVLLKKGWEKPGHIYIKTKLLQKFNTNRLFVLKFLTGSFSWVKSSDETFGHSKRTEQEELPRPTKVNEEVKISFLLHFLKIIAIS